MDQNKLNQLYKIDNFNLLDQSVFLRLDLNVSVEKSKIISDFRLKAAEPTIKLLLSKGAKIILATHIGRPKNSEAELSTQILLPWFRQRGYTIFFAPNLKEAEIMAPQLKDGQILLLENLRFNKQETAGDFEFACKLKRLSEYYINDAFAALHRTDTSITELPKLYDSKHKSIGLLILKELKALSYIKDSAQHPFLLIIGGSKTKEKLTLISLLLDKIDCILAGPAISFQFAQALSMKTGTSLVNSEAVEEAKEILKKIQVDLILPEDYLVAKNNNKEELRIINNTEFESDDFGISIGPNTLKIFLDKIKTAKTILLNGTMGFFDRPETLVAYHEILNSIANSKAYTVVAGGDSVSAVYQYNLESKIDFCSSGGGATLEYLSGKELPGLKWM